MTGRPRRASRRASLGAVLVLLAVACGEAAPPDPPPGMVLVPASVQRCPPPPSMTARQRATESERVPAFFADVHEVTNAQFAAFVEATGYVTDAERIGDSVVFVREAGPQGEPVFELVVGADWRHPEGPSSSLEGRADHPVVNVSWNDASAYAAWAGKRLPTRGEWFAMARAGQGADASYPWGDSLVTEGQYAANVWQGVFPLEDTGEDGFVGTAPVGSFPPGPSGIHDLGGNVWEWTAERSHGIPPGADPALVPAQPMAITRGGSFLCRERAEPPYHACQGYQIGRAEEKPLEDGNNQVGFRCVKPLD